MIRRRLTAILGAAALGISLMPADSHAAPIPAGPVAIVTALPTAAKIAEVRIATFNVRTARAKDKRSWLARVSDVSREILSRKPGVVLLQELGPGRADGKKAKINGAARQTTSLTARLSDSAVASTGWSGRPPTSPRAPSTAPRAPAFSTTRPASRC